MVHRQSPLGPVDPSFRALSGRLKFTVRRHKFNEDSLLSGYPRAGTACGGGDWAQGSQEIAAGEEEGSTTDFRLIGFTGGVSDSLSLSGCPRAGTACGGGALASTSRVQTSCFTP